MSASTAPSSVTSLRPPVAGSLSDEQALALSGGFDKSATICAGAGAGKTRLLVERAAALVKAGAHPQRVAVVTFTRRAAEEISARLFQRFGDRNKVPICATVHSLALSSLLRLGHPVCLPSDLQLHGVLDKLRDELPETYRAYSDAELMLELNRCREEEQFLGMTGLLALRFEELVQESGFTDFTSLLSTAVRISGSEYDHILVDEAQDLSRLQLSFLRVIGTPKARYWFIGDPDQAIYAFRGANQDVMRTLQASCDEQFTLTVNYRSARAIVSHANNVIRFNADRIALDWRAHRSDEGSVDVLHFDHGAAELEAVERWLKGSPERAVLGRTQALVSTLREKGLKAYTVHESKGLEWAQVWIMGCEAALFPHPLSARNEERRLFYVAMTRARDQLTMSYSSARATKSGAIGAARNPSCFLFETQALQG